MRNAMINICPYNHVTKLKLKQVFENLKQLYITKQMPKDFKNYIAYRNGKYKCSVKILSLCQYF